MKRLLARLFTCFAAFSLVLGVVIVIVWVRSYRTTDLVIRSLPVRHVDPLNTETPIVYEIHVYGCGAGRVFTESSTLLLEPEAARENRVPSQFHYLTVPTPGYDPRTLPGGGEATMVCQAPIYSLAIATILLPVTWTVFAARRHGSRRRVG